MTSWDDLAHVLNGMDAPSPDRESVLELRDVILAGRPARRI